MVAVFGDGDGVGVVGSATTPSLDGTTVVGLVVAGGPENVIVRVDEAPSLVVFTTNKYLGSWVDV